MTYYERFTQQADARKVAVERLNTLHVFGYLSEQNMKDLKEFMLTDPSIESITVDRISYILNIPIPSCGEITQLIRVICARHYKWGMVDVWRNFIVQPYTNVQVLW